MVWVWPPHTSMNLYSRPGSHRAAIIDASAWALSASRYSSTNLIAAPSSLDPGFHQGVQLVLVGLADALQELQRRLGLGLVDLAEREADVDQDPVAWLDDLVLQQADVDRPLDPADVDLGQVGPVGED